MIEDVTTKGTCDVGGNPAPILAALGINDNVWGWDKLDNTCTVEVETMDYGDYQVITEGTCSASTETLLRTPACLKYLAEQPNIIRQTIQLLIQYACTGALFEDMPFSSFGFRHGGERSYDKPRASSRLAPVTEVDSAAGTKTELNYENTRHRYPWICSLRTREVISEHLCAVNLLAVPPNPAVIVGSAHCTYLCKDAGKHGVALPPCCCVTKGQESCQDDPVKCGTDPVAVEMDGSDAEILCGEWQTGAYGQTTSGEEYNVVLPVEDIVRSPNFDAETLGPAGGSDIAVFKVNDDQLQDWRKNRIYPACLPPRDKKFTEFGVHSGWTKPPSVAFIEKFAKGYNGTLGDFFKQWHYKMKIQEKCADPTKMQAFG